MPQHNDGRPTQMLHKTDRVLDEILTRVTAGVITQSVATLIRRDHPNPGPEILRQLREDRPAPECPVQRDERSPFTPKIKVLDDVATHADG
ncbi:UmuC protein [Streptomyces sp. NBRC 110611]|nr:UmuC protein [Streptomyces sp. NBRC 110611]